MSTPPIRDFRPFLGYAPETWPKICRGARRFYKTLGFQETWALDNICEIDTGIGHRSLCALTVGKDSKTAGIVQFWVEKVEAWWAHIDAPNLPEAFPGVRVAAPSLTEWGWRLIYIWDPGGWLLHIGHPADQERAP